MPLNFSASLRALPVIIVLSLGLSACESSGNLSGQRYADPEPPLSSRDAGAVPPELRQLQNLEPVPLDGNEEDTAFILGAIRETAMALGAQGGLAHRSFEINQMLEGNEHELGQIYNFDRLLIPAPSGSTVLPPIVTQAEQIYTVADGGQSAAVVDRHYRIIAPARLVSRPPNWRTYLVRNWLAPEIPPGELLPQTSLQRRVWEEAVADGWESGLTQADVIFETDLNRLQRDIGGMVLYRSLVAQGVIQHLYLAEADRGITGGGNELRVGDRMVRITSPASLNGDSGDWSPVLTEQP